MNKPVNYPQISQEKTACGIIFKATGDWTLTHANLLSACLSELKLPSREDEKNLTINVAGVQEFDTSGAFLLVRLQQDLAEGGHHVTIDGLTPAQQILFDEVAESTQNLKKAEASDPPNQNILARFGHIIAELANDIANKNTMLGHVMAMLFNIFRSPRRLRLTSIVHHLEHTGLRAVPIVALMSFIIGGIIAQQTAFQLEYFTAEIFTVDLLGILVLREIGVLLAAIMVAGRSGSAFTAEIGSMKMREEIDALRVIGLSDIEVLVLPRVLALTIALPLLTVLSNLAALVGGGLMLWWYSDIVPAEFIARFREAVWLETLLVGFIKAPFMAFIIAIVSCSEGMAVGGSAESLGRCTTASVVKSIFMVIVADGIFAMFFAAIGY